MMKFAVYVQEFNEFRDYSEGDGDGKTEEMWVIFMFNQRV